MKCDGVRNLVEVLLAADADVVDRDELAVLVRESRRLRGWLDSFDVRCSRRTRELAAAGRSEPPESLLGDDGRRPSKEATAVGEREGVCDALPDFEEALANGAVSAGHLDAIANATRRLDTEVRDEFFDLQAQLLAAATRERIDQFERTCRDLGRHLAAMHNHNSETDELERQRAASKIKRWIDKTTGMHHTHVELDPLRDSMLKAALDAHMRRVRRRDGNSGTPWNQLEIEAFMNAITSGVTRNTPTAGSTTTGDGGTTTGSTTTGSATGGSTTGGSATTGSTTGGSTTGGSTTGGSTTTGGTTGEARRPAARRAMAARAMAARAMAARAIAAQAMAARAMTKETTPSRPRTAWSPARN